jgi:D-alanyl-D-alanine dipeptidase
MRAWLILLLTACALAQPEGLVELITLEPGLKLDIRYARQDNFMGFPLYPEARAFLQKPAAEALVRAHKSLKEQGYGLVVFDGYRPWRVTKLMYDASPKEWRGVYVADPAKGSRHNRGCAVDCNLFVLKTGQQVVMPSGYDDFSERAHADYAGGTAEQRKLRGILRKAMEQQGFTVLPEEWWHFDFKDWSKYPVMDVEFSKIK